MLKTKNICRVCSSRGAYDIFAAIPAYLHGSSNEFLLWKKDIAKILEETTGLTVNPNDNLPKKICALCISYLKHASIFRTQAINNFLSLQAAEQIINNDDDELPADTKKSSNKLINSATNILNYINDDNNEENLNIKSNLPNNTRKNIPQLTTRRNDEDLTNTNNMNTYLNLLFNKDTNKTANTFGNQKKYQSINQQQYQQTFDLEDDETFLAKDFEFDEIPSAASSDENEIAEQTSSNFFNYKETNFEEDDIINILKDYNVTINIPETDKERKCNSCFRRFMFEDTYLDHIEICVEHKLQTSVQALNRLYGLRRKKIISPHEFIRRMFFSLKKISEWIATLVLPDTNSTIIKNEIDLLDINNKNDNEEILVKTNNSNTNINWKTNDLIKQQEEFDIRNYQNLKNNKRYNNEIKSNDTNPLLEILRINSSKSFKKDNDDNLSTATTTTTVQSFPSDDINIIPSSSSSVNNNFVFPINNIQTNQDGLLTNKMDHEKIIALFED